MSDVTVSPQVQSVTVSPVTQAITVTVPYSNTATVATLNDLSDVTVTSVGTGYILRATGSEWYSVLGSTYFSQVGHLHSQSDVTGLVAFVSGTNTTLTDLQDQISQNSLDISTLQSTYPAHTSASSVRTSTTTLSTSAWTSLGSFSLTAGTWMVMSTVTVQHSTSTASTAIRINSSSTTYGSTEGRTSASSANLSLSCNALITLTGTTTIEHSAICSATTTTVQFQTSLPSGTVVGGATQVIAVRIA